MFSHRFIIDYVPHLKIDNERYFRLTNMLGINKTFYMTLIYDIKDRVDDKFN